ncbi:signal peptidase II, partial [Sansalvadorimonas verongulae]|uniref:signal peptidase II n=1 Tax=Sansalvadorimonas verongulae TaxID=2172824 RepID=UPI0012BD53FC
VFWLSRLEEKQKLQAAALTLILGGAVGNLIDRALLGHVVDFILVHYKQQWFFPAFNLADIGITVGAGLMILDMILNPEPKKQ